MRCLEILAQIWDRLFKFEELDNATRELLDDEY